jgi:hypothetical protein
VRIYAHPTGDIGEVSRRLADSVGVLAGCRIGILENGKANARPFLERVAQRLALRTRAEIALVTGKGADHNFSTAAAADVIELLARSSDVVLTGTAD